ncbi:MAG: hypothetical protein IJ635_00585 [Bacteroidaceae bacterium]|nr:hypothetical protein [Bacteroidaceae bacterium]
MEKTDNTSNKTSNKKVLNPVLRDMILDDLAIVFGWKGERASKIFSRIAIPRMKRGVQFTNGSIKFCF